VTFPARRSGFAGGSWTAVLLAAETSISFS
jgi:hypothetical protein